MNRVRIAVPYFPGSNGLGDVERRIEDFGMQAEPLYFHIGHKDLEENAKRLLDADGAVLPGGFPYEDRLGFGVVPAKLEPFSRSMRRFAESGRPVIAFCSGNQIGHAMNLVFPEGSPYKISMEPNISEADGEIVYTGFYDGEVDLRLSFNPQRNAFTRHFTEGEIFRSVVDHGGGRFSADDKTLEFLLANGMIATRYCDEAGSVIDRFPYNPNGSVMNIEGISNIRGNVLIGMAHHERKLNALEQSRANMVFLSMREYIEEGCPNLSRHARPHEFPLRQKDYSWLSPQFDPKRTVDIYVEMLTDDNERNTAELFLGEGFPIQRRRLIRVGTKSAEVDSRRLLEEIARVDVLDGVMLKKDLPTIVDPLGTKQLYTVVDAQTHRRDFVEKPELVEGNPFSYEMLPMPNPHGESLRKQLNSRYLKDSIERIAVGSVWFFPDEEKMRTARSKLLG